MRAVTQSHERRAAAVTLVVGLPATAAVAVSGGGLAIAPLLLLLIAVLLTGRPPGLVLLERARVRRATPFRPTSGEPEAPAVPRHRFRRRGLLVAESLAERAPPAVLVIS